MSIDNYILSNEYAITMTINNPLRKCQYCGLEAYTEQELELFTKAKVYLYGRRNICKSCFASLLRNGGKYHDSHITSGEKWLIKNKEHHNSSMKARITFNGKRIYVEVPPRTGVCSLCSKKGITHIHHDKYDSEHPLENTRELCRSCHIKISNEVRRQQIKNGERKGWNIP